MENLTKYFLCECDFIKEGIFSFCFFVCLFVCFSLCVCVCVCVCVCKGGGGEGGMARGREILFGVV